MRFGSVCSGIEAASVAWHPLGWRASFLSEIEAFPRSVLSHHYPETPLHGDFTTIKAGEYEPIDLLVGGTPCQSFSVAGLRGGLDDDRGNLALEYLRLADRLRPRWLVWENVPGVLSSNGGRDFGAILGGMVELGYGVAYRVLDAQFFGVAQRRRRVFVVGYLGDWRRAAAVLFERHSLSGNSAPRRKAGPGVAALTANGVGTCGADDNQGQAGHLIPFERADHGQYRPGVGPLQAKGGDCGGGSETLVAHTLRGTGFDASEDGTGRGTPIVPVCFSSKDHGADALHDLSPTLRAGGHDGSHANAGVPPAIAFSIMPMNSGKDFKGRETDVAQPVMAAGPAGGNQGGDYVVQPISEPFVLMERGRNGQSNLEYRADGTANALLTPNGGRGGLGVGAVAYAIQERAVCENPNAGPDGAGFRSDDAAYTLEARTVPQAVAFMENQRGEVRQSDVTNLTVGGGKPGQGYPAAFVGSAVRRLTPRECERLQGFPDDYTAVPHRGKPAADGPRYKALGNSMAVPVMAHIGQRIAALEASLQKETA